ncbi:IS1182 family transposase [Microbacterium sp.]|uniref:IS1182 family transposase n=1 Tax=Microbacterium sp. TaxID=51671 RepID=UPI003A860E3D
MFEVDPVASGAAPGPVAPAGAAKTFRGYDQQQSFLLPPSLDDWLAEDDEARFISEIVDDVLDLTAVYASYESASGAPPYDPRMMLKLLLFAYATGVTSSREVQRRCLRDIGFRWLSGNQAPDYRSLARFRRRHLEVLPGLFAQVLAVCAQAGLVSLGRVALDGTKLSANASKHKAMSYDRIVPKIDQLQAEVGALLAEAEQVDRAEDERHGEDRRGDEIPQELARRQGRLAKLRAAKEQIEQDAAEKAAAAAQEIARSKGEAAEDAERAAGEAAANAEPKPKTQRNFTDPQARIMKTNHGFEYAFNAQATVDEDHQIVLATSVTQQATDVQQFEPMMTQTAGSLAAAGIGQTPEVVLVDAGYCSETNLAAASAMPSTVLIATGRQRHDETFPVDVADGLLPPGASRREQMAHALRTKQGRADYARRKAIVEPVFGQMKTRQNAGRLRLRGLSGAQGEWLLHALCHNLRKLRTATVAGIAPA